MNESLRKEDVIDGSFPITWFIGENDTGDSNDENPFNALAASKQGERFYRDQGWKTERIILKITVISYLRIILVCTVNY